MLLSYPKNVCVWNTSKLYGLRPKFRKVVPFKFCPDFDIMSNTRLTHAAEDAIRSNHLRLDHSAKVSGLKLTKEI